MTEIKITGMGMCMAAEIHLITEALKKAGFDFEINDAHPCEDEIIERQLKLKHKHKIKIEVEHLPWCG